MKEVKIWMVPVSAPAQLENWTGVSVRCIGTSLTNPNSNRLEEPSIATISIRIERERVLSVLVSIVKSKSDK